MLLPFNVVHNPESVNEGDTWRSRFWLFRIIDEKDGSWKGKET
jgi:hypothetical protein